MEQGQDLQVHTSNEVGMLHIIHYRLQAKSLINIQKDRFSHRVVISLKIHPAQDMWLTQSSGSYCDERKNVKNTFSVIFRKRAQLWLE